MVPDKSPTRVLVVEDSASQAQELQTALEAEGYQVEVAADGRAGLAALSAAVFDVVLSDVLMPHLSGYDLCRAVKADPALRHTPVLLLTSLGTPQDVIHGLECGADNFIRKPFEADYLSARINAAIAAKGDEAPPGPAEGVDVNFMGRTYTIAAGKVQALNFLASTFEDFARASERERAGLLASQKRRHEEAAAQAREERLRAEGEALRASEERFRAFMDNNHSVAFMKDGGGRWVYVNGPFLRAFGGEAADWLGKTDAELWPEAVAAALRQNDASVLAGGESVELLETVPTPTGGARLWSSFKFPFKDSHGRQYLGGVAVDVTEERRAAQEIRDLNVRLERRVERINALRRIDQAITASHDLGFTLRTVLDQVTAQLGVDAAAVLLLDPGAQELRFAAGAGFRGTGVARSRLRPGQGCAGRAAAERRTVNIPDLGEASDPSALSSLPEGEGFVTYYGVPLMAKGQVRGVLEVLHRARLDPDREWLDFLEALAGQAAIAVDNGVLLDDLQRSNAKLTLAYDATIEGWARALDLRDKETEGHSRRVTEMTVRLAQAMGFDPDELGHVRRGALLHDVGKLGIRDKVLLKPGKLDELEWRVMRRHPEYAMEWLAPIAYLRPALDIPYCHHERWDGTGYPRGLKGEGIPLAARVFAAVDVWDALRSDRPYRKAWPDAKVLDHLRSLSGTHLDPEVVRVFLGILTAADGSLQDLPVPSAHLADAERAAFEARHAGQADRIARLSAQVEAQGQELARAGVRLSELSAPDGLTGLMSPRQLREALEAAFSFAVRKDQPLTVLVLEVDGSGAHASGHGGRARDGLLCAVARVIREQSRSYDLAGRYSGGMFASILPGTGAGEGLDVAERLRSAVAGHGWAFGPVTVSVGVAALNPATLNSIEVLEEAERALGLSRELGGDRVTQAGDVVASTRGRVSSPPPSVRV